VLGKTSKPFPLLGSSSLPIVVVAWQDCKQNCLCWDGMTVSEHKGSYGRPTQCALTKRKILEVSKWATFLQKILIVELRLIFLLVKIFSLNLSVRCLYFQSSNKISPWFDEKLVYIFYWIYSLAYSRLFRFFTIFESRFGIFDVDLKEFFPLWHHFNPILGGEGKFAPPYRFF